MKNKKNIALDEEESFDLEKLVLEAADKMFACNRCAIRRKGRCGDYDLPVRGVVHDVLDSLIGILFPGCHGHGPIKAGMTEQALKAELERAVNELAEQTERAFRFHCEKEHCDDCHACEKQARKAVVELVKALPDLQDMLQDDIQAAYEGDPAANSTMEVVMSYPAIQAIAAQRIAHVLYENSVPMIPRIMTELAHSRTGIDIHPGAKIGRRFFIDHGTGVVIGETAVIGNNVKLYQGVTLGALSFPKGADGKLIKGIKRHPQVCDNVTIYAEATILGGDTVIGEGSEIGGNVWLTHSVPPHSKVHVKQPSPEVGEKRERRKGTSDGEWFPVI